MNIVALLVAAHLTFYGFGRALRGVFRQSTGNWPTTVAVGMAAVVWIGGILNLLHLAVPAAIIAMMAAGTAYAAFDLFRRRGEWSAAANAFKHFDIRQHPGWSAATGIALLVTVFSLFTQAPASVFNFHDDFQKYFTHPVRMLQTGSVFGSTLSTMGSTTLGGKAFLDGIVLSFFPVQYLNVLDSIYGFFLCMMIAAQFTAKHRHLWVITTLATLLTVMIDPQNVNITSLYIAAAWIMTLMAESTNVDFVPEPCTHPHPGIVGVIFAALIACKTTFLLLLAVHLPVMGIGLFVLHSDAKRAVRWMALCGFWLMVFSLPWMTVHFPNYLGALKTSHPAVVPMEPSEPDRVNLFSTEGVLYGATPVSYTLAVITALTAVAFSVSVVPLPMKRFAGTPVLLCGAAVTLAASYVVMIFVLGPRLAGYRTSFRYLTPFAIGLIPPIIAVSAAHIGSQRRKRLYTLAGMTVMTIVFFVPSLMRRTTQLLQTGSTIAFYPYSGSPGYLLYNDSVLNKEVGRTVADIQSKVPQGEPILAWIDTPFQLDFRRNKICEVDTAGVACPWASVPRARYLMWQYSGFATRMPVMYAEWLTSPGFNERCIAKCSLAFTQRIAAAVEGTKKLYDDGAISLYYSPEGFNLPLDHTFLRPVEVTKVRVQRSDTQR